MSPERDPLPGASWRVTSDAPWCPTASLAALRERARLLESTRAFFAARGVLEVTTPVLGHSGPPDLHLALVEARFPGQEGPPLYLQPSPESAMKRLLAAGSGPIYQLGPAFRAGERGARHNPEFHMLEWYRPGLDLAGLGDEADALLAALLGLAPARRVRYGEVFLEHAGLDPFAAGIRELAAAAAALGPGVAELDRDGLLDLLFSHRVQPALGPGAVQVSDFPASQAAMAQVHGPVARRVEVYVDGVELANGYQELGDAAEQRSRFEGMRARRRALDMPCPPLDEALLAALAHGLPPCAGMALGFDRLVMLALGVAHIEDVIPFPVERA